MGLKMQLSTAAANILISNIKKKMLIMQVNGSTATVTLLVTSDGNGGYFSLEIVNRETAENWSQNWKRLMRN